MHFNLNPRATRVLTDRLPWRPDPAGAPGRRSARAAAARDWYGHPPRKARLDNAWRRRGRSAGHPHVITVGSLRPVKCAMRPSSSVAMATSSASAAAVGTSCLAASGSYFSM